MAIESRYDIYTCSREEIPKVIEAEFQRHSRYIGRLYYDIIGRSGIDAGFAFLEMLREVYKTQEKVTVRGKEEEEFYRSLFYAESMLLLPIIRDPEFQQALAVNPCPLIEGIAGVTNSLREIKQTPEPSVQPPQKRIAKVFGFFRPGHPNK